MRTSALPNQSTVLHAVATYVQEVATVNSGCFQNCTPVQKKKDPPPKELDRIESAAEDLVDLGVANNWRDITSKIRTIDKNWPRLRSELRKQGVSAATLMGFSLKLATLKAQTARKSGRAVAIAANDLTSYIPGFLARYRTVVPPQVSTIDYLGRKIKFEGEDGNWSAAEQTLSDIMTNWNDVRPQVISRGGKVVAFQMDATIKTLESGVQETYREKVASAASILLDQVDLVENVFTKK